LNYSVEDESVARILVTRQDALTGYWKFDENMYAGAKDERGNYNGTLLNLTTTGAGNVWELGLFENALRVGAELGRVDFGSVEFDSNFSVSFWLKPEDVDSNKTLILSKQGISGMNLFRIEKGDQNSSLQVYLSLDGQTEQLLISSSLGAFKQRRVG
jgi:hypothetical protein